MSHAHTLVSMVAFVLVAGTASAQTAPPPAGYPQQPPPPGYGPQNPPPAYLPTEPLERQAAAAWQDGEPIPYGYHAVDRPRWGLVGGGLGMFIPAYVTSLLCAGVAEAWPYSTTGQQWWPLAVPAVGPLIAIGTIKSTDFFGGTVLVMDSGLQIGGIIMFAMGVQGHKILVRNDFGFEVQPMMNAGVTHTGNGVQLNFTF